MDFLNSIRLCLSGRFTENAKPLKDIPAETEKSQLLSVDSAEVIPLEFQNDFNAETYTSDPEVTLRFHDYESIRELTNNTAELCTLQTKAENQHEKISETFQNKGLMSTLLTEFQARGNVEILKEEISESHSEFSYCTSSLDKLENESINEETFVSEVSTLEKLKNGIADGLHWISSTFHSFCDYSLSFVDYSEDPVKEIPPPPPLEPIEEKDSVKAESKIYLHEDYCYESLVSPSELLKMVGNTQGTEEYEWITSQLSGLFNSINSLYEVVVEECTQENCPEMCGPNSTIYLWSAPGVVGEEILSFKNFLLPSCAKRKTQKLTAPVYIDYSLTLIQITLQDKQIFPTGLAISDGFPKDCRDYQSKISTLLFQIVAHIYHKHFQLLISLDLYSHLNCIFIHLHILNDAFNLVQPEVTVILQDLWEKILKKNPTDSGDGDGDTINNVHLENCCDKDKHDAMMLAFK